MNFAGLPLLRVVPRIGVGRLGRVVFALATIAALTETILLFRPDLLRPTDLGSDTSNYFAASQRLLGGHPLFELEPGDRPAPADYPPAWTVPILSPPTLAVLFAPLAILPGPFGMLLWWAACFAAAAGFSVWMATRGPPSALWLALPFVVLSAVTAWSGNVNALLLGMAVLIWVWSENRQPDRRMPVAVGVVVAVGAALKIGPIVFVPWLLGRGRIAALAAFLVTAAGITAATLVTAGPGAIQTYLAVSSNSAQFPTLLSPVGIARLLGMPPTVAAMTPAVMVAASGVLSLLRRQSPRLTFAVAAAVSVLASPIVRFETFAQLMMCFIPWAALGKPAAQFMPARKAIPAAMGAAALIALAGSIAAGGIKHSTVSIANNTNETRIVRFQVTAQFATFGFSLGPGQQGTAWRDLWGTVIQPVLIFDGSCRLLGEASIPAEGGTIALNEMPEVSAAASSGRLLGYDPACAARAPT